VQEVESKLPDLRVAAAAEQEEADRREKEAKRRRDEEERAKRQRRAAEEHAARLAGPLAALSTAWKRLEAGAVAVRAAMSGAKPDARGLVAFVLTSMDKPHAVAAVRASLAVEEHRAAVAAVEAIQADHPAVTEARASAAPYAILVALADLAEPLALLAAARVLTIAAMERIAKRPDLAGHAAALVGFTAAGGPALEVSPFGWSIGAWLGANATRERAVETMARLLSLPTWHDGSPSNASMAAMARVMGTKHAPDPMKEPRQPVAA
jgi:hypothetical protein